MTKQDVTNSLWEEKFRPVKVKDMVLPAVLKSYFTKIINEKDVQNFLFYSPYPGCGKTTSAKAICNSIGLDYLYINASKSGNIDTLRNEIERFAHSLSLKGNGQKVVILDECDGSSPAFQSALRAFTEEYSQYCRFILTANYMNRVIEPLRSRLKPVNFSFGESKFVAEMKPKILKRLKAILDFEKVEYSEPVLEKLIDKHYPDIREMIKLLQQYSGLYGKIDENIFSYVVIDEEFFAYIREHNLTSARKYIIEKNINIDELFRPIFDRFIPTMKSEIQAKAIVTLNDYQYKNAIVVDKEINIAACLVELMRLV